MTESCPLASFVHFLTFQYFKNVSEENEEVDIHKNMLVWMKVHAATQAGTCDHTRDNPKGPVNPDRRHTSWWAVLASEPLFTSLRISGSAKAFECSTH